MPHVILKRVWDYCTYSKKYLLFIFALLFISSLIQNYVFFKGDDTEVALLNVIIAISVAGYGMSITRSRINHGKRLPKIVVKDIIFLGIKANIVLFFYICVQTVILGSVCSLLRFPSFNLEKLLLYWTDTIDMFFNHDPANTILFLIFGAILFYVITFFMEIALAKLADTRSLMSAFNLLSIKRSIDVIGWKKYAKEYTLIVLTIVILTRIMYLDLPFTFVDSLIDMFLSFLVFATQYLGIGAIYCEIKDLELAKETS